jgi:hypothetical protein
MNYRLIATEVGELFKWDTSLKQIDRIAKAIFPFPKDTFPNDSISSQRAKLIYDWILSLARHPMSETERSALLRQFCQKIAPTDGLQGRVETLLSSHDIGSGTSPNATPTEAAPANSSLKRKEDELRALLIRFTESAKASPQERGYTLQAILTDLVTLETIEVATSFTRNQGGEQIDGAFRLDGWFYIVECRWRERLADIRQVDGLKGQVDRSGKQALGIFLSMEGWSENVPDLLKQNPEKSIFLMDGYDLMCVLRSHFTFKQLLSAKNSKLTLQCRPFYGAVEFQRALSINET